MAAQVCKSCDINYPVGDAHRECGACGAQTRHALVARPHADWQARVEAAISLAERAVEVGCKILANRALRLRLAGLDYDRAIGLAGRKHPDGSYAVSVHEFERLVERGATPDQAARILG